MIEIPFAVLEKAKYLVTEGIYPNSTISNYKKEIPGALADLYSLLKFSIIL